ncbi:hypothetical protein BSKO_11714 [Bryopsis sp. KO-2023]|nr:hypothetical protein BSKO_11714 [Bryopsis sp. KO-2023]
MSQDNELASLQVCVRVRPLFEREKDEGYRVCVHYDDPTKQVVLTAVDKGTLIQLHGQTARGFSFDRYYPPEGTSDAIYDDTVSKTVENCFKGYNGTVLAYGQTGSGKTHTMAGGIGIHGVREEGIIPRVIRHCFGISEQLTRRGKPGESTDISATSLEIYNEELVDLSPYKTNTKLKIQERALPQGGTATEVVGLAERQVKSDEELFQFFDECMTQRSVGSTKMNERSSRSHAIFTIAINRTIVDVEEDLDENLKAKILTTTVTSKLHLVDLAGSERVKRSGVSGQRLKEATHINGGLLALGNVIVALSKNSEENKKGHVPYRDSKLTRLLQDSLGGNSLTTLVTCISSSEGDFEETNNTLKYANRACKIKNIPLPNKYIMLEEDLLPVAPAGSGGNFGVTQLAMLLEEHERLKEKRAKRAEEKAAKEERRAEMLQKARTEKAKTPGYQRLRAHEYDRLRKEKAKGRSGFRADESISGDALLGFKSREPASRTISENGRRRPATAIARRLGSTRSYSSRPSTARSARPRKIESESSLTSGSGTQSATGDFQSWLSSQADDPEEKAAKHEQLEDNVDPQADQKSELSVEEAEPSYLQEATMLGNELESISEQPSSTTEDVQEPAPPSSENDQQSDKDALGEEKASNSPMGSQEITRTQDSTDSIKVGWGVEEDGVSEFTDFASITEEDDDLDVSGEYHALDNMFSERPELLARFKINKKDVISIFKSCSREDYQDVMSLLPENTPLPASDRMTYLLSRLEIHENLDIHSAMNDVAAGHSTMKMAIGPAVGCLMATYGTNMISSCIFEFEDPVQLFDVDERIELWGLQIPHNSARPTLEELQQQTTTGTPEADQDPPQSPQSTQEHAEQDNIIWSSVDRLSMSVGLLYALCNHARKNDVRYAQSSSTCLFRCGFCVPRPQLLRRWAQAGVAIKEIESPMKLLYPSHAHDYDYYKSSTVAYFMVDEVQSSLIDRLSLVPW